MKIRGFRVEPGEVEAALERHPEIERSAVVVRQTLSGDARLAAYIVTTSGSSPGAEELRRFLVQTLPDSSVPALFIRLERMPLTPNGKVDRRALAAPLPSRVEIAEEFVLPRTDLERKLAALWEELLGVRPVGIRNRFFDLGGDSLIAARMISRIQEELSKRISMGSLLQAPTIETMAELLQTDADEKIRSAVSAIVEIQPRGSRPPLFLVHGVGGGMFWGYTNLARHLGSDQPIYGFKSRGLDGLEEFGTLDAMAAQYVADLRSFQPSGPYYLGGYCFGGNVAYEMAQQLKAQGQQVALLALFNCWPSNCSYDRIRPTPGFCARFLMNLFYWAGYTLRLPPAKRREVLLWKTRVARRKFIQLARLLRGAAYQADAEDWLDLAGQPEDRRNLWSAHMRSVQEHVPEPYDGHVAVFRSRGHQFICSFDDSYGWRDLARGGVSVHIVPGAHESILEEPYVRGLSTVFKNHLANLPGCRVGGEAP